MHNALACDDVLNTFNSPRVLFISCHISDTHIFPLLFFFSFDVSPILQRMSGWMDAIASVFILVTRIEPSIKIKQFTADIICQWRIIEHNLVPGRWGGSESADLWTFFSSSQIFAATGSGESSICHWYIRTKEGCTCYRNITIFVCSMFPLGSGCVLFVCASVLLWTKLSA